METSKNPCLTQSKGTAKRHLVFVQEGSLLTVRKLSSCQCSACSPQFPWKDGNLYKKKHDVLVDCEVVVSHHLPEVNHWHIFKKYV